MIDELHGLYARRPSKIHGRFSTDAENYPTERHLLEYVDGETHDFARMTRLMLDSLQVQARRRPNAGTGHVFFAHVDGGESGESLLVAILNDKLGAALSEDLDVRDVRHLDMEGFRFAGRISLRGWQAREPRYIGFLKGKGDVADYFREFLGCDATIQSRVETTDLVGALKSFAEATCLTPETRDAFLARASSICTRYSKTRTEISFQALANELVPENPQPLIDVLADPDRGLSDGFVPDGRALKSLVKYSAQTRLWKIEFDREALSQGSIVYNHEQGSLTLTDLPAELVAKLAGDIVADG